MTARMGELLAEMPKATGAKGIGPIAVAESNHNTPPTLADLGIEKTEAHRAQTIAADLVPLFEAEARERMAEASAKGGKVGGRVAGRGRKKIEGRDEVTLPSIGKQDESKRAVAQAAQAAGAGVSATKTMAAVKKSAPEVAELVRAGKSTVAEAKRATALPEEERREAVKRVENGEARTLGAALKEPPRERAWDAQLAAAKIRDGIKREAAKWPARFLSLLASELRAVADDIEPSIREVAAQ